MPQSQSTNPKMGSSVTEQEDENPHLVVYTPIPTSDQNYVVLQPLYSPPHPLRKTLTLTLTLSLLSLSLLFLLFPSDPSLSLARLRLTRLQLSPLPHLSLDLSLDLSLRVRNCNFFSFDYSSLDVSIGYRGRDLGVAGSDGGRIGARATSYLNATLDLDGLNVIHDVVYLLADVAKGSVLFETESEVKGSVGIFFLHFPIRGRISCEMLVNTKNLTIMHQDCHPV